MHTYIKRHTLVALLLALALGAAAQRSTVSGTITGLPAGTHIVIGEPQAGRIMPSDTVKVDSKGRFRFERYSHQPEMIFLGLSREKSPILHLLLLPKEKVTLDMVYMPSINLLDITSTSGSDNMKLYKQFANLNVRASLQQRPSLVADSLALLLDKQPNLLISAFLVTFFEQDFDQRAALYKKIRDAVKPAYPNHEFVQHLDNRLRTALTVGMQAPDIVMRDPEGKERRLSDLRGTVVLIDFWASWCGPCRRENPHVVRLYQRFRDKGFEVFSVSLDQSRDAWVKAIKDDGLVWPNHVSDLRGWQSAAGRLYGINSVPSTILVDRQGNILARNLRGAELERKLTEIFAQ